MLDRFAVGLLEPFGVGVRSGSVTCIVDREAGLGVSSGESLGRFGVDLGDRDACSGIALG